jgi:hypothetical protein
MNEQEIKELLKKGRLLPILPRHGVHLIPLAGDGRRFASLFRTTWRRMPLWARRRILGHWRSPRFPFSTLVPLSPQIELVGGWSGRVRPGVDALADVSRGGHLLRFHAGIVGQMPDDVVCDLIAHELAHVFQDAGGLTPVPDDPDLWRWPGGEMLRGLDVEVHANEMVWNWGFEVESIDEWCNSAIGLAWRSVE